MNLYEKEWENFLQQILEGHILLKELINQYVVAAYRSKVFSFKETCLYTLPSNFFLLQENLKNKTVEDIRQFYTMMGSEFNIYLNLLRQCRDLTKTKKINKEMENLRKMPYIKSVSYNALSKEYRVNSTLGEYIFYNAQDYFKKEIHNIEKKDKVNGEGVLKRKNLMFKCHFATQTFFLLYPKYAHWLANCFYCKNELLSYYWTHSFIENPNNHMILDIANNLWMDKNLYNQLILPIKGVQFPGEIILPYFSKLETEEDEMPFLSKSDILERRLIYSVVNSSKK